MNKLIFGHDKNAVGCKECNSEGGFPDSMALSGWLECEKCSGTGFTEQEPFRNGILANVADAGVPVTTKKTKINGDSTYDDIIAERNRLQAESDEIDRQLMEAKMLAASRRKFSDPDWFARATYAVKRKRRLVQALCQLASQKRKQTRQASGLPEDKRFVASAKRLLTPEQFAEIVSDAGLNWPTIASLAGGVGGRV